MNPILHLRIAGAVMLLLVGVNLYVPRFLGWQEELRRVSLVNRQIFQVHATFIVILLGLLAALLLACAPALAEPTALARAVLLGLTVFWGLRLSFQLLVYDPRIWRGKRFETAMHALFTATWGYLAAVFGGALLANLART